MALALARHLLLATLRHRVILLAALLRLHHPVALRRLHRPVYLRRLHHPVGVAAPEDRRRAAEHYHLFTGRPPPALRIQQLQAQAEAEAKPE